MNQVFGQTNFLDSYATSCWIIVKVYGFFGNSIHAVEKKKKFLLDGLSYKFFAILVKMKIVLQAETVKEEFHVYIPQQYA
ncbi:hypothetical protein A8F95_18005 [Bacillus wudalianchiensis]|uniref:Uncharacterized protein n=1 Tax=Pseudobacillus wudalianchiensis TaxID=1743143 RepID=A0A1B9B7J0_9BACI|nr:hypothetical protein A8F95_18005 [Bacillus wudalianchiensis]